MFLFVAIYDFFSSSNVFYLKSFFRDREEKLSYTYDLSITLVKSWAGGCLTTKNPLYCGTVFVDLFHFLLFFYYL